MVALVEVKTSHSDFKNDSKWTRSIPSDLAYLAYPAGMIGVSEWPEGWGILEYHETCDSIKCRRPAVAYEVKAEIQRDMIYEISLRRDHHTRYERLRKFRRESLIERNSDKSLARINDAFRIVLAVAAGVHGSVDGVLEYYGVRKLADYLRERLDDLWNVAPEKAEKVVPWEFKRRRQVEKELTGGVE